jgi:hypothetical protein
MDEALPRQTAAAVPGDDHNFSHHHVRDDFVHGPSDRQAAECRSSCPTRTGRGMPMNRNMIALFGLHRLLLPCLLITLCVHGTAYGAVRRALLIGVEDYAPPEGTSLSVTQEQHSRDSRFAPGTTWAQLRGPMNDVASMQFLLSSRFGFGEITVLEQRQATRLGILEAIDRLIAATQPGDFDVIYYAGHGSRRLDSLSSKNHLDQTIVPIDAWKGIEDIRDKELAARFNQIVFEKRAHLTAIFDSCSSGTMARGVSNAVVRALPYDDRDVAQEKARAPQTIVEADLKQLPQQGDAIIVAAAAVDGTAVEARYADDLKYHGAFTRALVRVLQSNTQTLSAEDVIAATAAVMHADPVPFQQPSVEGRSQQSLFGAPVTGHALHVRVTHVAPGEIDLDLGSLGGFDLGTRFKLTAPSADDPTEIEVTDVSGPMSAKARVTGGSAAVEVGAVFELSKMVYRQASRLTLFASSTNPGSRTSIEAVRRQFPRLTWVQDPAVQVINYLVLNAGEEWVAYRKDGKVSDPPASLQGAAFLLAGPPDSLIKGMRQSASFQAQTFRFTLDPAEANYFLTMRVSLDGTPQYALIDPIVLLPHGNWVQSAEADPDDAALNGGVAQDIVCPGDVSLPVRTAWLSQKGETGDALILALLRRIVRLGRLLSWQQSAAFAPGTSGWPYKLEVFQPASNIPVASPLRQHQSYEVRLVTTAEQRATNPPSPKYVYLVGFDCAANPKLLYPRQMFSGEPVLPQPGPHGVYPLSISLDVHLTVEPPLGADTLFVLLSEEKLATPEILVDDGALGLTLRGYSQTPSDWSVQQRVLASQP